MLVRNRHSFRGTVGFNSEAGLKVCKQIVKTGKANRRVNVWFGDLAKFSECLKTPKVSRSLTTENVVVQDLANTDLPEGR